MVLMINTQLGMRIYGGKNECNVKAGQLKQDSQKPYWLRKPLKKKNSNIYSIIYVTKQCLRRGLQHHTFRNYIFVTQFSTKKFHLQVHFR